MKVLGSAAMREADRRTIEELGLPGIVLMETAASRVVELVVSRFLRRSRVVILAGPGNNGGDGLAVARLLINAGYQVSLFSTVRPGAYRGDAGINECFLEKTAIRVERLGEPGVLDCFKQELKRADLLIDALLGIGVDRTVEGLFSELINSVNGCDLPVLAVDIPSGVNADTGIVMGCAIDADWTVAFAFPKKGLLCGPGVKKVGELYLARINVPSFLAEGANVELITSREVVSVLPARPNTAHKGSMGRVLIIAGSPGMSGAAVMAAESALRSGAGLVYLAVPASLAPAIEAKTVEVITLSLPEALPGVISAGAADILLSRAAGCEAVAVGPGLDPGLETLRLLEKLIAGSPVPLVLDAGALEALKGHMELLEKAKQPPVLTPHPGEMSRLVNREVATIQENRLDYALEYAKRWQTVLLLKGYNTIIATPEGRASINPTGGPALATAGSGDLLTGTIASFVAQGVNPFDAAKAAAYIHGLAGDLTGSRRGHTALCILDSYKEAFKYLEHPFETGAVNPYLEKVRPY